MQKGNCRFNKFAWGWLWNYETCLHLTINNVYIQIFNNSFSVEVAVLQYIRALIALFFREEKSQHFPWDPNPRPTDCEAWECHTVLVQWVQRLHATQSRHSFGPQWSNGIAAALTICGSRVRISEIVLGFFFNVFIFWD